MAGPKIMQTDFGIHHRMESCGYLFSGSAGVNSGRLLSRRPQACNRGPPKTPMTVRVKSGGGGGGRKWSGGKNRPVYVANSLASGGSPR